MQSTRKVRRGEQREGKGGRKRLRKKGRA